MKVPFVDLNAQYQTIKDEIDEAIAETIRNTAFVRGPSVDAFEEGWANLLGVRHCLSCANGTDALYIAMRGLGIKPGDEVITTAHSWISTTETITQAGGKVVFVDTELDTFNIDAEKIAEKVTPRTVGIIPVHLYGQACDMDAIMGIARKHGLWVVEDCAQAHLAEFRGQKVGTFGNAATFSFYPGKNLGAYGDAGCVVTNDSSLNDWMTLFARHGGKGDHQIEGINSRMDGIQAAILNVKYPRLAGWTRSRQDNARRYNERLDSIDGVATPFVAEGRSHVYHLYVIKSDRRDDLRARLSEAGIGNVLNYPKALPFYKAYEYLGHQPQDFPNAFGNQSKILSIPMYPELSGEMIEYVASQIESFQGKASEQAAVLGG